MKENIIRTKCGLSEALIRYNIVIMDAVGLLFLYVTHPVGTPLEVGNVIVQYKHQTERDGFSRIKRRVRERDRLEGHILRQDQWWGKTLEADREWTT